MNDNYINKVPDINQIVDKNMQLGNWEDALEDVAKYLEQYPEHEEAHRLKNQIVLKIHLDTAEIDDFQIRRKQKIVRTSLGVSGILILLILAFMGFRRLDIASLLVPPPTPTFAVPPELKIAFASAETFIAAGKYDEAEEFINKVKEFDPTYSGLDALSKQLETLQSAENLYQDALVNITEEKNKEAYELLNEILELDPLYKDVSILIKDLERLFELEDLLQRATVAHAAGDWEEAIINYKAFLAFSQSDDLASVEDSLFESYIQMIKEILSKNLLALADLKYAGELLLDARKLNPQDSDTLLARSVSENEVLDQLVGKYILLARTSLYDAPNSTKAMIEAKQYLSAALGLNPHSAAIYLEFELLTRYLKALETYDRNQWDDVIIDVRYIFEKDPDFVNGAVFQFLYEAYASRGSFWVTVGNYSSAAEDFQQAVLIASNYPDSIMMNYEAQLNLAYAMGQTGNYKDAANLYKSAIEQADVKSRAQSMERIFFIAISAAETNLRQRIYERSYYFFADAVEGKKEVFTLETHTFKEGDHIIFVAKEYNSTVQLILDYNDLIYTDLIKPGQQLLIPTLP